MEEITIKRKVDDCRDCPNSTWESCKGSFLYNYYCEENEKRRLIMENCSGISGKIPSVPKWCPCKNNK